MKNEKFLLAVLFVLCLGINNSFAQFYVGSNIGVGFSTVSTQDRPDNLGLLFSQRLGVSLQIPLKSYFSLRAEGRWSSQGYKSELIFTDANGTPLGGGDVKQRLNYAQFQTQVRFEIEFIYIAIGPYVGFLTGATRKFPDQFVTIGGEREFDVKDEYRTFDVGIGSAFGFLIELSEAVRLELGIQNTNGFLNTLEDEDFSPFESSRNFDFGLQVGLQVNLGKEKKG
ncbi:MAG: outer membrane beta-barrel protein [Bacteroidota bacterium]